MKFGWDRIKSLLKSDVERRFVPDYSDTFKIWIDLQENGRNVSYQSADENINLLVNLSNASVTEDGMRLGIPYEDIYEFYFDENGDPIKDYNLLNLPPLFDGIIFIQNKGNFAETDQVTYTFQFKDGSEHDIRRLRENILLVDGQERVLAPEMYECLKLIIKYNQNETLTKDIASQFELLAEIKDYAERTNVALNQRLSIESKPIVLDKIKLDFTKTAHGLEVKPVIESRNEAFNQSFVSAFDRFAEIKNFYSIKENGKDVKVVIKNKELAEKIKRNRLLTGDREKEFYRGQNEIFEDENFDLSAYGPRVKGLGYLNYRAIVSPSNNNDESWFDFTAAYEPPSLYTDELIHPWRPEDQERLQKSLAYMERQQENLTEIEIEHEGETYKVPLTRDQLASEIDKITQAIVDPRQIKSTKDLREIRNKCKADPNQLYIEHKGRYVKNYGLEMLDNQLERLSDEGKHTKDKVKDPTLLIKDNLNELEHTEEIADKPKLVLGPYEDPRSLKVTLYEHQIEGVRRLQALYNTSISNGFLLADDMGLGKTIQILTFHAWLKEKGKVSPSLIVAPTTLINNWDNDDPNQQGEIQKFFQPETFKTYKIQGIKKDSHFELQKIKQCDLVFITYESLRLNHLWLGKVHWQSIVCDEVQAIKNPKTLVSVALKAMNGDFKIACSATPIENTTEDLWNIMDFALPGVLGSLQDFKRNFVKPIDSLRSDQNDERKALNDNLVQKIDENFLRRSKEDKLKDLPQKKVIVHRIEANEDEKQRIAELNRLRQEGESPLALIQKLIASCSHPRIESSHDISQVSLNSLVSESSKLTYLKNILDSIRTKNEKVIIFTMFRQMQIILYKVLSSWYGIQPKILNGTLSTQKRSKFLSEFRQSNGFNVIILSPLAAGVGITLTEANHVIHYTRLWNPAKEAQATDRVYRIGQQKDVYVYYPMLTFESSSKMQFETEQHYLDHFLQEKTTGRSPEEKLNRLLTKKKNMLNNFFLAAGNPNADIIEKWDEEVESPSTIKVDIIDRLLTSSEFGAASSVLYQKSGSNSYRLLRSGDLGADLLIEKDGNYGLVQCRTAKEMSRIDLDKLYSAKNIYESHLSIKIKELIIMSTSQSIPYNKNYTTGQKITYLLGNDLEKLLSQYPIMYSEILNEAEKRFSLEQLKQELF